MLLQIIMMSPSAWLEALETQIHQDENFYKMPQYQTDSDSKMNNCDVMASPPFSLTESVRVFSTEEAASPLAPFLGVAAVHLGCIQS